MSRMRASLGVLEQTFRVQLDEAAGEGARRAMIATHLEAHGKVLQEQQQREGVPPDFVHVVDGVRDRPLEQVAQQLVTLYDYRREAAAFLLRVLRRNSPVRSGAYRDSHTLFVNGQAVAALPSRLRPTDKMFVANPVPYARRLEVGRRADGSPVVVQVPPGIYERSLKEAVTRYRNVLVMRFGYVDLKNSYVVKGRVGGHYRNKHGQLRKRDPRGGEAVRFPAIFVESL